MFEIAMLRGIRLPELAAIRMMVTAPAQTGTVAIQNRFNLLTASFLIP